MRTDAASLRAAEILEALAYSVLLESPEAHALLMSARDHVSGSRRVETPLVLSHAA